MPDPRYLAAAEAAAAKYGVPASVLKAQIGAESGWNPHAHSPVGASGIAQFMPGTARSMGVNAADPFSSIDGMARLDARNLKAFGGDIRLALAAYNAGGGAARHALTAYPETRNYVAKIMGTSGAGNRALTSPEGVPAPDAASHVEGDQHSSAKADAISAAFAGHANGSIRDMLRAAVGAPAYTPEGNAVARAHAAAPEIPVASHYVATGPAVPTSGGVKGIESLFSRITGTDGSKPTVEQTTGGHHAAGGWHGLGRAADFGDATYSRAELLRMAAYAKVHPEQFKEFFYNPAGFTIKNGVLHPGGTMAGHDDHEHIAI